MAASEDAESRAGVTDVSQIKQSVDDRNRVVQRHGAVDNDFREPIQDDNDHHPAEDDLEFDGQ